MTWIMVMVVRMEGIRRIWEVFRVVDESEIGIREKPRVIRFGA